MDMSQKTIKHMFLQREYMYIPTYQRRYTWKRENVIRLLDDIERVIENLDDREYTHYIGTVYIQEKQRGVWELIDGQQRVTTITLLVQAIINNISDRDSEMRKDKEHWRSEFLEDRDTGENKIELSYDDEIEMEQLRDGIDKTGTSEIKVNYRIIEKWLNENYIGKEKDIRDIVRALDRLRIIEVALSGKDNAQEVFDGINATGQPLTLGDQVKNYLLMPYTKEEQEDMYMNYWRPVELEFGTANNFQKYLKMYITIRNEAQTHSDVGTNAYERFKHYKERFGLDNKEFLEELKDNFDIYKKIENNRFEDRKTKEIMRRLSYVLFKDTDALGYLIQIVKMKEDLEITENEFKETLEVLEGYILRRILNDGYTQTHSYYNYLNKIVRKRMEYSGESYSSSLRSALNSDIEKRTPSDNEIRIRVKNVVIYRSGGRNARYLLERIENGDSKEQMDVYSDKSKYTVEHIMPQQLSEEWKRKLGESQVEQASIYEHTLGNLTLTGYNSEYSNRTFEEKMEDVNGYRDSRFTNLNNSVVNKTVWDINTIKNRTEELAQRIMDMYPYE